MMGMYSSGALGGVEVLDGGLVGGELTAHVLSAQAAAHAAASAAAAAHQQQQIAVQQIKTSPSSGRSTPVNTATTAPLAGSTSPSPSKLFVGGLSWQTSSEKLREYFAMFGPVTDVLIMKDPVTQLLLECGLVRPTSSGLFTLLPLARRALDKLEALVRQTIDSAGGQRVSLPALTAAQLWEKTGRLDEVGSELMRVEDRHGKKYLLAPTHEEAIADLLADAGPLSYKQLPLVLYQINNKYRDEQRPKHGLLRAREFTMLDAYGAHASRECAEEVYSNITEAYWKLFRKLDLPVHRVSAPCGDMGGSLSHEWQVVAGAGEDVVRVCPRCGRASGGEACPDCGGNTCTHNSIEVGHTFILGTKYSEALKALFIPPSGAPRPVTMSCYGIGITRLLAASLEALSSEKSLRWPRPLAPYDTLIVGPKEGSKEWQIHGPERIHDVYTKISRGRPGDVLIDDRHHLTVGKRLMLADRIGFPNIVVCGRAVLDQDPKYELHRSSSEAGPELVTLGRLQELIQETGDEKLDQNESVNKEMFE